MFFSLLTILTEMDNSDFAIDLRYDSFKDKIMNITDIFFSTKIIKRFNV